MPKKVEAKVIEAVPVQQKPKKTRTMTPEALERLKKARELAIEARKNKAKIESENKQIKETFGEKFNNIETFKKLKEQADEEVKKNEIVVMNKRLEDLTNNFSQFLEQRQRAKEEKAKMKEQKRAQQYAPQVASTIDKHQLEASLRALEIENYRKRYFGV